MIGNWREMRRGRAGRVEIARSRRTASRQAEEGKRTEAMNIK
jgi:hypothetical protein